MPVVQITRKTRMTGKQTFLKTENSRKMDPLMVTWTFFVFSINNICTIESYVREKRRVSKGLLGQETGQVERREWEQLGVVGRKHVKEAGRKEAKWGEEETGRRRDRREEKGTIDYDKTNCIGRFLREILSKPYQICFWTQKSNGLQTLFWNVTSKWFITGQVVHNSSSLVVWLESWVLYFMYKATVWYTWKVDGGKGMIFYCERNAVKTWLSDRQLFMTMQLRLAQAISTWNLLFSKRYQKSKAAWPDLQISCLLQGLQNGADTKNWVFSFHTEPTASYTTPKTGSVHQATINQTWRWMSSPKIKNEARTR